MTGYVTKKASLRMLKLIAEQKDNADYLCNEFGSESYYEVSHFLEGNGYIKSKTLDEERMAVNARAGLIGIVVASWKITPKGKEYYHQEGPIILNKLKKFFSNKWVYGVVGTAILIPLIKSTLYDSKSIVPPQAPKSTTGSVIQEGTGFLMQNSGN